MSRQRQRGFTIVEVMISLAIGAIVVAGMYQAFNTIHKWWIASGVTAEQRQSARAGLETVTRDLEMAGYQTSNYGDPSKGGVAITFAAAHEIEVDQQRPRSDTILSGAVVYEPRLVYYHLATDMRTGRQNLYRQIRTQPGLSSPDQIVAENVSDFTLAYFDRDNRAVAGLPPAAAGGSAAYSVGVAVPATSPLRAIRRIQVTLATLPARSLPIGPEGRPFTLTASVAPQNLAAADEVVPDDTPPAVPTGLTVIEKNSCTDKLRVKWNPNPEADLEGYILFYGPTGSFTVPLRSIDKSDPRVTLNPPDLLITKNADKTTKPNTYAIQIAAYDSSGNHSAKSAAVSGNPTPEVTEFDQTPFFNDSTVNPVKPPAPTGLTVAAGTPDGELVLTWTPTAGATAGYRLYRSTAAFVDGHIPAAQLIQDETTLTSAVSTWTDTNLEGCTPYYYALAAVNCDETLVALYQHNAGNAALSDYAVASGSPHDGTPPPAPGLACSAGVQKAVLTLTNPLEPACADFDRTEVFWSKAPSAAPHLDGSVVGDGTPVPDREGVSGTPGSFGSRGSQVIVMDSETEALPATASLTAGATYNFLAVSHDTCGNLSPAVAADCVVLGSADCVDDPAGPPPDSFTSGTAATCQADSVTLGWEYPGSATVPDLAGFRVERTGPAGTVELTGGPTSLKSWTDPGPLEAGAEYSYTVTATDCAWEQYLAGVEPLPYAGALPALSFAHVLPGGLQRYTPASGGNELAPENFVATVSDVPTAYTYHNNVRLSLANTSRGRVTLKRMAVTWDNPNVVLASITVGGAPSTTTARTVDLGGVSSGTSFSVGSEIVDLASGVGSPSGAIPLSLRFTTPGGAVNRLADMRNDTLEISLWVWNHSFQDLECANPARLTVDVPRGPLLGGFSQSAPGLYGIDSYEVIGASATARDTDIKVPYGIPVNVFGTAFDYSRELFADGVNRGFDTLKVVGINVAAASTAATPVMPATGTFFERPLQTIGGDRYTIWRTPPGTGDALMPQVSEEVVWYYALAVDRTGNWDRVPAPDAGSYAYYQSAYNVCSVTPLKPGQPAATAYAGKVVLSWCAPETYTNGDVVRSDDRLTYDVSYSSDGGATWLAAPNGTDLSSRGYTHGGLSAGSYRYKVRAKNSCMTCTSCGLGCCSAFSTESASVAVP
jgi:type IV pilus assembly protein PilW